VPSTRALLSPHEMFQLKVIIKRSYVHRSIWLGGGETPVFAITNISYFVGLDAQETRPDAVLSGDSNLTSRIGGATSGSPHLFLLPRSKVHNHPSFVKSGRRGAPPTES